jgi:hypothetical protein
MKMKGTSLLAHAVAVSRGDGMLVAEAVQIETVFSTTLKQPRWIRHSVLPAREFI